MTYYGQRGVLSNIVTMVIGPKESYFSWAAVDWSSQYSGRSSAGNGPVYVHRNIFPSGKRTKICPYFSPSTRLVCFILFPTRGTCRDGYLLPALRPTFGTTEHVKTLLTSFPSHGAVTVIGLTWSMAHHSAQSSAPSRLQFIQGRWDFLYFTSTGSFERKQRKYIWQ